MFMVMRFVSKELFNPEHTTYYGPFATEEAAMAFGIKHCEGINGPWGWEELHAPEEDNN